MLSRLNLKKTRFQRGLLKRGVGLMLTASLLMVWNCANIGANIRNAEQYTRMNKITLGTMIAAQVADGITTDRGIKAGAIERNPILGDKPSTESIALFTVTAISFKWLLGHIMPPEYRNWFWGSATVLNTGAAIHNNQVYQDIK